MKSFAVALPVLLSSLASFVTAEPPASNPGWTDDHDMQKIWGPPSRIYFAPDPNPHPFEPGTIPWQRKTLSQEETNGNSKLGTLDAPKYHPYMGAEGLNSAPSKDDKDQEKYPWGNRTAKATNAYTEMPDTGKTREYHFVIERGVKSPDGVEREVMLVNGEFPGPTIVADWGDRIEVTVENRITGPEEGTALHWHGLLHKNTPWEDGVPGVTQYPIAPGETFTYSFLADLYGSTWYHSHYSAQYAGGVFGAMIIHGPSHVDYDEDLGPVLLSDTYHREYYDILEDVMGTNISAVSQFADNNLIQGKGTFDCSLTDLPCALNGGYAKFKFETGKTYRLRLVNSGSDTIQHFSIDDHVLTVIANDMVPVVPYETNNVVLGIGQRTDVVVKANSKLPAVWMRSTITKCSLTHQPNGLAAIYYDETDTTIEPQSQAHPPNEDPCANDDLEKTVPFHPITPPATPAREIHLEVNSTINETGHFEWTVNDSSFRVNYNDPVLYRAQNGASNYTFPPEWNTYNLGDSESIRLIIHNLSPVSHPMHMHGHNMYVLADGPGIWDGSIVRPENPQRRDTQQLRPANKETKTPSHIVIQIDGDNPGVWPFHCHIAWHVSGGLYVNLLEKPDEIRKQKTPQAVLDLGIAWHEFTGEGPINQIDSGL